MGEKKNLTHMLVLYDPCTWPEAFQTIASQRILAQISQVISTVSHCYFNHHYHFTCSGKKENWIWSLSLIIDPETW